MSQYSLIHSFNINPSQRFDSLDEYVDVNSWFLFYRLWSSFSDLLDRRLFPLWPRTRQTLGRSRGQEPPRSHGPAACLPKPDPHVVLIRLHGRFQGTRDVTLQDPLELQTLQTYVWSHVTDRTRRRLTSMQTRARPDQLTLPLLGSVHVVHSPCFRRNDTRETLDMQVGSATNST